MNNDIRLLLESMARSLGGESGGLKHFGLDTNAWHNLLFFHAEKAISREQRNETLANPGL